MCVECLILQWAGGKLGIPGGGWDAKRRKPRHKEIRGVTGAKDPAEGGRVNTSAQGVRRTGAGLKHLSSMTAENAKSSKTQERSYF